MFQGMWGSKGGRIHWLGSIEMPGATLAPTEPVLPRHTSSDCKCTQSHTAPLRPGMKLPAGHQSPRISRANATHTKDSAARWAPPAVVCAVRHSSLQSLSVCSGRQSPCRGFHRLWDLLSLVGWLAG